MDCNSSRCEYSIFHQKGCRDPACLKVRSFQLTSCVAQPPLSPWTALRPRSTKNCRYGRQRLLCMSRCCSPLTPTLTLLSGPCTLTPRVSHDLARARARSYPLFIIGPQPIISMALSLHYLALPLLPCCLSGLILSRRHTSSHTQCSQLLPSMSVSTFTLCALLYYYPCLHCSYIMNVPATSHTSHCSIILHLPHLATTPCSPPPPFPVVGVSQK